MAEICDPKGFRFMEGRFRVIHEPDGLFVIGEGLVLPVDSYEEALERIHEMEEQIRRNPASGYDLQEDLSGFKSAKCKRHRIIYKLDELNNSIDVYVVGHRRDVYEQFRALLKSLS